MRDLAGKTIADSEPKHAGLVNCVEFSATGDWLVTASAARTAILWRWTGQRLERHAVMRHEAAR